MECYRRTVRPDWQWFESRLTYANAVLPHALFIAAQRWPEEDFADVAETSFAFLDRATTAENVFWPVGNSDWYSHGERKSLYDQQPVEAVTMADAALAAFGLLRDEKYLSTFCRAHDWFHGQNSLKEPLADTESGACFDGLQPLGVNRNQGAESTLAYLWTEVHNVEMQLVVDDTLEVRDRHAHDFTRRCQHSNLLFKDKEIQCCENRKRQACTRELFHRHPANPILTAQRLALSGAHCVQRRRMPGGR